jgi:hypothetical protein
MIVPLTVLIGRLFKSSDGLRTAVQGDVVFQRTDFRRSRRQDQVLGADGVDHVAGRQPEGLELGNIDIDLDLPLLASIRIGAGQSLDGRQRGPDKLSERSFRVCSERVLLLRLNWMIGTLEALYWMISGGVVPTAKLAELRLGNGGDLRHGHVDLDRRMKEDLDHANTVERLRFGMLDVIDRRGQAPFRGRDNPLAPSPAEKTRCNSKEC